VATLVVSDLHLGARSGVDVLHRPGLREPLIEALRDGIERLVILGDGLELREVPVREAAAHAVPLLREAGAALGPDGEIVILGGNHDHALLAGWTETHLMQDPPRSMALSRRIEPRDAGPLGETLAEAAACGGARLHFSYPGIWIRDDVFAFHGHYLDVHTPVPTIERLAAGAMTRWVAPLPDGHATPDDYEAILVPLYAWIFALAQRSQDAVVRAGSRSSAAAWVALTDGARRSVAERARTTAQKGAFAAAVAGLNAAGIGPLSSELSGPALRRGSLVGIGEVLRRLGVQAPHVIFGHTHRSGPWPGDDPAEWRAPTGSALHNTGSWVYQPHFLTPTPGESPYWPGTAVRVGSAAGEPPQLLRLLADHGHEALRPERP
jgi:hypothetical protein